METEETKDLFPMKESSESLPVKSKSRDIDFEYLLGSLHEPFCDKQLVESLASLVVNLGDRLSEYNTLLSDDVSGRLITLLLRDVANRQRKEIGKRSIQTYFIAGGRYPKIRTRVDRKGFTRSIWKGTCPYLSKNERVVRDFIKTKKDILGKTLLVTEHIKEGKSFMPLVKILTDLKIDFDVATVSIENPESRKIKKIKNKLFYGLIGEAGAIFHEVRGPCVVGVVKDFENFPAHPVKFIPWRDKRIETRREMKQAREDIKTLGRELYKLVSNDKIKV